MESSSSKNQELAQVDASEEVLERPKRHVKLPQSFGFKFNAAISLPISTPDQLTVSEAMEALPSEVSLWKEAIVDEFKNLFENETWKPVLSCDYKTVKPLATLIVLKLKRNGRENLF